MAFISLGGYQPTPRSLLPFSGAVVSLQELSFHFQKFYSRGLSFHSGTCYSSLIDWDWNNRPWLEKQSGIWAQIHQLKICSTISLQQFYVQIYAHASQLSFLASIIFKGPSSLSHGFQWAILSFLLLHPFCGTCKQPAKLGMWFYDSHQSCWASIVTMALSSNGP